MEHLLRSRFGFEPGAVRVLLDHEATRDGILSALNTLAGEVGEEDQVVFYFSGHGSWMEEIDDGISDEPDRRDQTLVPVDSGRCDEHPPRDILDDEIYEWLLRVGEVTPFVTFIFDSCYAGTAVRDPFAAQEKWMRPWRRRVEGRTRLPRRADSPGILRGPRIGHPLADRYALLAACKHNQKARVMPEHSTPVDHSAFTYCLLQELSTMEPGTTYRELLEVVRERVSALFSEQTPYVEGARDREVFGFASFEPARFIEVVDRTGETVTLGGGAALGITLGSEWNVYPPGTRRFHKTESASGRIEIDQVRAVTSTGRMIEEDVENPIRKRCRAALIARDHVMQMGVQVPGDHSAVAALRAKIKESDVLRLSDADDETRVCVYRVAPREGKGRGLPVPQFGDVREPMWALVARDGWLLVKPQSANRIGSIESVVKILERYAGFLHVVSLRDSEEPNPLQGCLRVTLLRQESEGTWGPAAAETLDDVVEYAEGDWLALEVSHRYSKPLHITVLDLGLTGRVAPMYPVPGDPKPLIPNHAFRLFTRKGERQRLAIPDEYPGDSGWERIRVFATTHPLEVGWLTDGAFRRASRGRLERLLATALGGGTFREAPQQGGSEEEHWTVESRCFRLRRRLL